MQISPSSVLRNLYAKNLTANPMGNIQNGQADRVQSHAQENGDLVAIVELKNTGIPFNTKKLDSSDAFKAYNHSKKEPNSNIIVSDGQQDWVIGKNANVKIDGDTVTIIGDETLTFHSSVNLKFFENRKHGNGNDDRAYNKDLMFEIQNGVANMGGTPTPNKAWIDIDFDVPSRLGVDSITLPNHFSFNKRPLNL